MSDAKPLEGSDDGSLQGKLDRMALSIADRVIAGETVDPQTISALKALTSYFAVTRKRGKRSDDDEPEGETFDDFREQVSAANGGGKGL